MRRITTSVLCCLIVLGTALASVARADEQQANELRAQADAMLRDVRQLVEKGENEAAQQLERDAAQLRDKAEQVAREERPEPDRMRELAQHLQELSQQWLNAAVEERGDAVERIEKEIHEIARDAGARMHEIMQPALETIRRKMDELREQGHPEVAERIGARVREMMIAHNRAEAEHGRAEQNERQAREQRAQPAREGSQRNQERFAEFEKRVDQLQREGKGEQADQLMERLANLKRDRDMPGPQHGPQSQDRGPQDRGPDDRPAMEQRMQHLRVAAENLHQVGMHDLAEKLDREAQDIQRGLQGPPPENDPHGAAMEAIHQEFRKLHERLDEINRRLDELNQRRSSR